MNNETEIALLELEHRYGKEVRDRVGQMGFEIPKRETKMSDLISREASEEYCLECIHAEMCSWYPYEGCDWLYPPKGKPNDLDMLYGIEAVPTRPKKARWVDTEPDKPDASYRKNGMAYFCSNCGHRAGKYKHKTYKYCPWCGAEMEALSDDK